MAYCWRSKFDVQAILRSQLIVARVPTIFHLSGLLRSGVTGLRPARLGISPAFLPVRRKRVGERTRVPKQLLLAASPEGWAKDLNIEQVHKLKISL